jgi:protein tyrosine/serine phosphatase
MHSAPKESKRNLLLLLCILGALAGTGIFEHLALAATKSEPTLADPPLNREIPNFSAVHPYLYRGALPTPFGMEWLKTHGVKTIIDLREADTPPVIGERITASAMGFNYINLPVRNLPTTEQLRTFQKLVSKARDGAGPVFVHCNYGSDRTGFFVFIWRIVGDRWRWSLALCEMIEHGFFIHKFGENKSQPLSDPNNW